MIMMKLQNIPQKTHGYQADRPRDIRKTATHKTIQSTKVADTGGPTEEREDEYDSQTRPQEFMHPHEQYLYLYASDWIKHSYYLLKDSALEIE
jgi:hypothetical protein